MEMLVEAGDGHADRADGALGAVFASPPVLALEFEDLFEVAEGFVFDGFGCFWILEDGFEFLFFAEEVTHRLGIVEREAALLEPGAAEKWHGFAGYWIDNLCETELFAVHLGNFGDEV